MGNANLDMPVVKFRSNAKPSTFGYPPNIEEKKKETGEKVSTAILSITAKQKKQSDKSKTGEEKMDVDTEKKDDKKEKMEVDEKKEEEKPEEEKKEPEALFEMLSNPARVMKAQLKVINLEDGKY